MTTRPNLKGGVTGHVCGHASPRPPRSDSHVREGGGEAVDRFDEARVGRFEPLDREARPPRAASASFGRLSLRVVSYP